MILLLATRKNHCPRFAMTLPGEGPRILLRDGNSCPHSPHLTNHSTLGSKATQSSPPNNTLRTEAGLALFNQ